MKNPYSWETRLEDLGVFTIRTPLLPFDELAALNHEHAVTNVCSNRIDPLEVAQSLRSNIAALRDIIARPEVFEAIFVASSDVIDAVKTFTADPTSKREYRTAMAVHRYFSRMTSRPTPFGLFAGCAAGRIAESTALCVPADNDIHRHVRIDTQVLAGIVDGLCEDRTVREQCTILCNPTIYQIGPFLRFYARAPMSDGGYQNELLSVGNTSALTSIRSHLANKAGTFSGIVALLAANGVAAEDARQYVHRLLELRFLMPGIELPITGDCPARQLASDLVKWPSTLAAGSSINEICDNLDALNRIPLGNPAAPHLYMQAVEMIGNLGKSWPVPRAFHVEVFKSVPSSDTLRTPKLSKKIADQFAKAINALHLVQIPSEDRLKSFREAFRESFGDREMPLLQVLDEEIGIGFAEEAGRFGQPSELIESLPFPKAGGGSILMTKRDLFLQETLTSALSAGQREVELDLSALEQATKDNRPPLPNYLEVIGAVVASSAADAERGDFKVYIHGAFGPTVARMAARFTVGDDVLRDTVGSAIALEAADAPDVVFAEIVHLADPRPANVVAKPVLRKYEIEAFGKSGAPVEDIIELSDLTVIVRDGHVALYSKRLAKQVIPRATSMHVARERHLGLYRFLIAVANQFGRSKMVWDWGSFRGQTFLPRITAGKAILAPARWRIPTSKIVEIASGKDATTRFTAMRRCCEELQIPRWISFAEGDNLLAVDMHNVLSVESFLPLAKKSEYALLLEFLPDASELLATGPKGHYVHEIILPMRRVERPSFQIARIPETDDAITVQRHFGPSSKWATIKIYGGAVSLNRLLQDSLAPLINEEVRRGCVKKWFFIRYRDPDLHLRIRLEFSGEYDIDHSMVRITKTAHEWLSLGMVRKIQNDTYVREIERYGGPKAISAIEEIFAADSEAVVELSRQGYLSRQQCWRSALTSIQCLIDDFCVSQDSGLAVVERTLSQYGGQIFLDDQFRRAVSQRYRKLSKDIEIALDPATADASAARKREVFKKRSAAIKTAVTEILALEQSDTLAGSLDDVVASLIHMNVNRIYMWGANDNEPVLYDALSRWMKSARARRESKDELNLEKVPAGT